MSAPKPQRQDGGPAFPYAFQHEDDSRFVTGGFAPGISLRDWFAGQALANLADKRQPGVLYSSDVAVLAYEMADAMLAAREQKKEAT